MDNKLVFPPASGMIGITVGVVVGGSVVDSLLVWEGGGSDVAAGSGVAVASGGTGGRVEVGSA